jgi:hypothetical protein
VRRPPMKLSAIAESYCDAHSGVSLSLSLRLSQIYIFFLSRPILYDMVYFKDTKRKAPLILLWCLFTLELGGDDGL